MGQIFSCHVNREGGWNFRLFHNPHQRPHRVIAEHWKSFSVAAHGAPDARQDIRISGRLFDPADVITHEVAERTLSKPFTQQHMPENNQNLPDMRVLIRQLRQRAQITGADWVGRTGYRQNLQAIAGAGIVHCLTKTSNKFQSVFQAFPPIRTGLSKRSSTLTVIQDTV